MNQIQKCVDYLIPLINNLDHLQIDAICQLFLSTREKGGTIYFAGNGGSASTASHFAQDLGQIGYKLKIRGFKTVCLNDSISIVTAIGNDFGYEHIFSIQINNSFGKNDTLVVLSASGNSPNVVNAVCAANDCGGTTVGLTGFDGGKLKSLCDHLVHVDTELGQYGPVESVHLIVNHIIFAYLLDYLDENTN